MHTSRRLFSTLAGVLVLSLLAGCGGNSSKSASGGSSGGGPVTKADYVAQANAICASARTQTGRLLGEVESATTAALKAPSASGARQLVGLIDQLHGAALTVLGRLEKIKQPAGDHAAIEQFLTPLSRAIAGLGQAVRAITAGHATQALGTLLQLQSSTPQLASAAQAYGLTQCEGVLSGSAG